MGGGGRSFKVRGAKLWNGITFDKRKKDTAGAFKNTLKKIFFCLVLLKINGEIDRMTEKCIEQSKLEHVKKLAPKSS